MGKTSLKEKGFIIKSLTGLGFAIAKSKFKLKNEGTWLGVLWYLLAPIFTFIFMVNIFKDRLGTNIPNYPLYLLLGIILFNFFRRISDECVVIIRNNAGIIKSLKFPRESLVMGVVMKTLFGHIFEIMMLIAFLLYFRIPVSTMIFYPIVLFFLIIFAIGAGLILSSVGMYFFDLGQIWGFLANIIWFITPVFYSIESQRRLYLINLLNPMYFIITFARDLIIHSKFPEWHIIFGTIGYSFLALFIGIIVFNKLKGRFAELI